MDTEKGGADLSPFAGMKLRLGHALHVFFLHRGPKLFILNVQGKRPAQSPEHFVDLIIKELA